MQDAGFSASESFGTVYTAYGFRYWGLAMQGRYVESFTNHQSGIQASFWCGKSFLQFPVNRLKKQNVAKVKLICIEPSIYAVF